MVALCASCIWAGEVPSLKLSAGQNDLWVKGAPGVFMDLDTANKLADMKTLLDEHRAAETAKVVTGARSMGEGDDFVAEMQALGADEYRQIYDDAYADYVRPDDQR